MGARGYLLLSAPTYKLWLQYINAPLLEVGHFIVQSELSDIWDCFQFSQLATPSPVPKASCSTVTLLEVWHLTVQSWLLDVWGCVQFSQLATPSPVPKASCSTQCHTPSDLFTKAATGAAPLTVPQCLCAVTCQCRGLQHIFAQHRALKLAQTVYLGNLIQGDWPTHSLLPQAHCPI